MHRYTTAIAIPLLLFLAVAAFFISKSYLNGQEKLGVFLETRVSEERIRADAARCTPATAAIPKSAIGISEPHMEDPIVRQFVRDLKVPWVRTEFHWKYIDIGENYQWSSYDAMVRDLPGVHILGIINEFPDQLSNWDAIESRYERFVVALVDRYARQGVHDWEIFNEPNLPGYGWLPPAANPKDFVDSYVDILALSNIAIRAQDRNAVIVMGGLSPDGYPSLAFLNRVYALGAGKCFDVVAFHPYGYQGRFSEAAHMFRTALAAHNDNKKMLWFNEYGTSDDVNKAATLQTALADRSAIDGFFWFSLRDFPGGSFGLVSQTNRPKPAYYIFKQSLAEMRQ